MHCYICNIDGDIKLLEHKSAKWLRKDELKDVDWLPADIAVINRLINDKDNMQAI